jgi:hypothetical protein
LDATSLLSLLALHRRRRTCQVYLRQKRVKFLLLRGPVCFNIRETESLNRTYTVTTKLRSADLLSGVFFVVIGAITAVAARNLDREALMGIGPGYFPMACAGLLAVFGAVLIVTSMLRGGPTVEFQQGIRPALLVTSAIVIFATILERAGIVVSVFALVLTATRPDRTISLIHASLIASVLALGGAVIFRWGLGLPFPILPAFL